MDVPRVGGVRCCTFLFLAVVPVTSALNQLFSLLAPHFLFTFGTFGRLGDVETTLPVIGVRDPSNRFGLYTFFSFFPVYVHPFRVTFSRPHPQLQLQPHSKLYLQRKHIRAWTWSNNNNNNNNIDHDHESGWEEEETFRTRLRTPRSGVERAYEDAEYEHVGQGGYRVYTPGGEGTYVLIRGFAR